MVSKATRFFVPIRQNPTCFGLIWKHREHPFFERRVVRKGDDLVIEGFPRSGNTFATRAFRIAQEPAQLNIGNHFHASAQVRLAKKYNVPAMVVFREPVAATLSFVTFLQGQITPAQALKVYIDFHKPLVTRYDAFSPAPFDEVISDFGASIDRLNTGFGTQYNRYENSPEADKNVSEVNEASHVERMKKLGREAVSDARSTMPSEAKRKLRAQYKAQFDAPEVQGLKQDAQGYFDQMMAHPLLK